MIYDPLLVSIRMDKDCSSEDKAGRLTLCKYLNSDAVSGDIGGHVEYVQKSV